MARKPTKPEGPTDAGRRARRVVVGLVLAFAALLRVVPMGVANPRFYHLDEWNFALSAERMIVEADPDPQRYIHPALFRYAIVVAYPLTHAALTALGATAAQAWLPYIAGRAVSAAMGVLAVWLVYRLARRLMPWRGALLAALILAAMPLHAKYSHIAKPEATMAMWVTLTTLLACRLAEEPTTRLYVLAGLCSGCAVASKYNGVVACVAIFAAHMAATGGPRWPRRLVAWRLWLAAACSVAAFAATSPYTLIRARAMLASVGRGYHNLVVATRTNVEVAPLRPALVDFGLLALTWVGAVPLALAVAAGWLWWRSQRRALLVVGSVVAATLALISTWAVRYPMYLMPLTPAVAVLAAAPVAAVWRRRRALGAALAVACLGPSLLLTARELARLRRPDTRQLAQQWLIQHPPTRHGIILRDYDSLWDTARDSLIVKNPGFDFYAKVDRAYLKQHGISHFVLSDNVAATGRLTPEARRRKLAARERLLAMGERLARVPPQWWREGPGIEIYRVRPRLLREFAAERDRAARDLVAKVAAAENELARRPADAALHMEAGRLLCRLATLCPPSDAAGAWRRAEAHFAKAAEADPALADAHYNAGCLYLRVAAWLASSRQHDNAAVATFGKAVAAFRKAIDIDPAQADYHFNLGYALSCWVGPDDPTTRQRTEAGKAAYRQAAALDPALRIPDFHILAIIERGSRPLR